jgi:hypothetical protein
VPTNLFIAFVKIKKSLDLQSIPKNIKNFKKIVKRKRERNPGFLSSNFGN